MLPALAICRTGQADVAAIAEMKRRLLANEGANRPYDNDDNYKSALFVALLKLGEESFLRSNLPSLPASLRPWAEAVLQGQGATGTGPNNCMAQRWNFGDHLAPAMMPGLEWVRGVWIPRRPNPPA